MGQRNLIAIARGISIIVEMVGYHATTILHEPFRQNNKNYRVRIAHKTVFTVLVCCLNLVCFYINHWLIPRVRTLTLTARLLFPFMTEPVTLKAFHAK